MIFPPQAFTGRFIGGNQRAAQAVGEGAATADLDSECDRDIEWLAVNLDRTAEQGMQRFHMVPNCGAARNGPGKNAFVALIDGRYLGSDLQSGDDLIGQ